MPSSCASTRRSSPGASGSSFPTTGNSPACGSMGCSVQPEMRLVSGPSGRRSTTGVSTVRYGASVRIPASMIATSLATIVLMVSTAVTARSIASRGSSVPAANAIVGGRPTTPNSPAPSPVSTVARPRHPASLATSVSPARASSLPPRVPTHPRAASPAIPRSQPWAIASRHVRGHEHGRMEGAISRRVGKSMGRRNRELSRSVGTAVQK